MIHVLFEASCVCERENKIETGCDVERRVFAGEPGTLEHIACGLDSGVATRELLVHDPWNGGFAVFDEAAILRLGFSELSDGFEELADADSKQQAVGHRGDGLLHEVHCAGFRHAVGEFDAVEPHIGTVLAAAQAAMHAAIHPRSERFGLQLHWIGSLEVEKSPPRVDLLVVLAVQLVHREILRANSTPQRAATLRSTPHSLFNASNTEDAKLNRAKNGPSVSLRRSWHCCGSASWSVSSALSILENSSQNDFTDAVGIAITRW